MKTYESIQVSTLTTHIVLMERRLQSKGILRLFTGTINRGFVGHWNRGDRFPLHSIGTVGHRQHGINRASTALP
jgi:hypothetical protein